jgi:hypothetical protein
MTRLMLPDVASLLGWRIYDGTKHMWTCYGPNARYLDFRDQDDDPLWQVTLIFDTETSRVIEISAYRDHDPEPWHPWRWIDPEFRAAHLAECDARSIASNEAWDGILYHEVDDTSTVMSILEDTINART